MKTILFMFLTLTLLSCKKEKTPIPINTKADLSVDSTYGVYEVTAISYVDSNEIETNVYPSAMTISCSNNELIITNSGNIMENYSYTVASTDTNKVNYNLSVPLNICTNYFILKSTNTVYYLVLPRNPDLGNNHCFRKFKLLKL